MASQLSVIAKEKGKMSINYNDLSELVHQDNEGSGQYHFLSGKFLYIFV